MASSDSNVRWQSRSFSLPDSEIVVVDDPPDWVTQWLQEVRLSEHCSAPFPLLEAALYGAIPERLTGYEYPVIKGNSNSNRLHAPDLMHESDGETACHAPFGNTRVAEVKVFRSYHNTCEKTECKPYFDMLRKVGAGSL